MQCVQCGRSLTPANLAAGACPSCGAPIRVTAPEPVPAPPPPPPAPNLAAQQAAEAVSLAATEEPASPSILPLSLDIEHLEQPLMEPTPTAEPTPPAEPTPVVPSLVAEEAVAETVAVQETETLVVTQSETHFHGGTAEAMASTFVAIAGVTAESTVVASPAPLENVPATEEPVLVVSAPLAEQPAPVTSAPPAAPSAPLPPPPIAKVFEQPPPARRNNPALIIILVVAVLAAIIALLFVVLGGKGGSTTAAATPTPAPTATLAPTATPTSVAVLPAPPPGFTIFASTDGTYALYAPQAWVQLPQTVTIPGAGATTAQAFAQLAPTQAALVVPIALQVPPDQYVTLIQQNLQGVQGAQGVQINPTTQSVTYGANTWTKITGTFTYNGQLESAVALVTPHGTGTYVFVYFAAPDALATAETTYFLPMAQSFTFLK